ncbi:MAG TPA: helix-turn-helix domain-containing protein [Verrucomicrobiae bacterium]|nr:helix-turn-helix domain-containing protein [Verrucomicrobiae bacterium]
MRDRLYPPEQSWRSEWDWHTVHFSTLEVICETLDCQPGEILEFRPTETSKTN